ncbi:MAG: hypothetical protein ACI4PZ_07685, partial [Akkermansia sp.]
CPFEPPRNGVPLTIHLRRPNVKHLFEFFSDFFDKNIRQKRLKHSTGKHNEHEINIDSNTAAQSLEHNIHATSRALGTPGTVIPLVRRPPHNLRKNRQHRLFWVDLTAGGV